MGRGDLGDWTKYIHLHLNKSLQKAGASYGQDQLPNQHILAWQCCGHLMQACQKQQHAGVMPPSQTPQLDKRNLISTDILGGFCHCLQQTLSTSSLADAPFGSCTATPDSVLMLFSYSQTGKLW